VPSTRVKPPGYVPLIDQDLVNLGYSRRSTYFIPREQLLNYVPASSDAVKNNAITWNTNIVRQAMKDYPNSVIELDPTVVDGWPLQLKQDGNDTTNWPTQIATRLKGKIKQPVGSFQTADEATAYKQTGSNPNGRVPSSACIEVVRPWEAPQDITSFSTVLLGPNLPPWYSPSQPVTKAILAAGAYSGWKLADIAVVMSGDSYDASVRAGYDNVWKAQKVAVMAIGMDVANYTTAAASTANVAAGRSAVNINGANNGMESRQVRGATSTTVALCRGDSGANQLLFTSIPGNFTAGEDLYDVQTNTKIGTVGQMWLVLSGKLYNQYLTTPCIRRVNKKLPVSLDLEITTETSPNDTIIAEYNRPANIGFTGTYDHAIKIKMNGAYQRGAVFTSAFRGRAEVIGTGLPSFALENDAREGAYGYGCGTFGCTEDILFQIDMEFVRHGLTTNVVGGTFNLTAAGGSGTNAQSTNYQKYGTTRNITVQGTTKYTFGAGIDTHEACEGLIIQNFSIYKPNWGGRNLNAGVGVNTRGFNTIIRNGYIEDVTTGITDASQNMLSGFVGSRTRIMNVIVNGFSSYGYSQGGNSGNYSTAETYIEDCLFRGNTDLVTGQSFQAGIRTDYGQLITKGVVIEAVNGCMIQMKGTGSTDTPKQRGGSSIHINPVFDFSEGTANTVFRFEAHMDVAAVVNMTVIAGGPSRPASIFRHEIAAPDSGQLPTNVQWWGYNLIQTTATPATPTFELKGAQTPVSTATNTRMRDPGEFVLPAGGTTGQALIKKSAADGDIGWGTVSSGAPALPAGGSTGQVLRKSSGTDGDAAWAWPASATKVNLDGVFQGTLDLSSTPVVKIVSIDADISGPVAGTLIQDVAPLQTSLPAGTYDVEAAVVYSMTSGTAGSPRLGIGGAGSANATLPTGLVQTTQATSAATQSGSRFWLTTLGVPGAAAAYPSAAGQAPVAGQQVGGVGVGSFALPMSWELITKVTLTATGVIGIVGHVSNGGDRVMTIKAGSKIKFTKIA
jgi:hypothetical protein